MTSPNNQKLLKISGLVKNGVLVLASDEEPLPAFSEGSSFEILIDSSHVPEKSRLTRVEDDKVVPFLPKGSKLLAQVNADKVPEALRGFLHKSPSRIENCGLVEIILQGDLEMRLSVGREGSLIDVGCLSPFFEGRVDPPIAESVNHAYSLISTFFEPHRKSHSGNAFDRVYYQPKDTNFWMPLRNRREEIQRCGRVVAGERTSK